LASVNGYIINNYTGKCNDIYEYLENLDKREIFNGCEMNSQGEVTELKLYPYCLEDEHLESIFSLAYDTLETLSFSRLFIDFGIDDRNSFNILLRFGCSGILSNFAMLNKFTNLKNLDLFGFRNLSIDSVANLPNSIETLRLGDITLTQEMVDAISQLTNLKTLKLEETVIGEELNFKQFRNLKNLTYLDMNYGSSYVQGNQLKYCRYLKKLYITGGIYRNSSLDGFSSLTRLEELDIDGASFESDTIFSSIKNLKSLISLSIICYGNSLKSFSSGLFYLTNLKRLTLINLYDVNFFSSSNKLVKWSNLRNLEYIRLQNIGSTFKFKYLGELRNLKEAYLNNNQFTSGSDNIGNLKKLEILDLSKNNLYELPKGIGKLKNLRILLLNRNNLKLLPDEIGNLSSLEQLLLTYNKLTSLPETIGNLTNLQKLNASDNEIGYLPSSFGNLASLVEFNFGYNQITELPKSIGNLNVTGLNFYKNNIEKLPEEIGNMKNLVHIYFPYNKITNIPSSIGRLENLETIYLNDNLIDDYLPESLNNLPKLRVLSLENNINIKGKTLTNPTIERCVYYPPSPGNTYSICESVDATCKDYFRSLTPCEE